MKKEDYEAALNESVGLTERGTPMPQTPEEFAYLAAIFEKRMLKMKEENSELRRKYHNAEQTIRQLRIENNGIRDLLDLLRDHLPRWE
jgi:hypothetical protein